MAGERRRSPGPRWRQALGRAGWPVALLLLLLMVFWARWRDGTAYLGPGSTGMRPGRVMQHPAHKGGNCSRVTAEVVAWAATAEARSPPTARERASAWEVPQAWQWHGRLGGGGGRGGGGPGSGKGPGVEAPLTLQGHAMSEARSSIPVVCVFYTNRDFGKAERLQKVRRKEDVQTCPLFQRVSLLQTRQLNDQVYLLEQGDMCKDWCEANCVHHVRLDDRVAQKRFQWLHERVPGLKGMNTEFTYAYARMWHLLELAESRGWDRFAFNDGDVMTYTSAAHMIAHFEDQGQELAYCMYWPRANNLFSIFTVDSMRDMIAFAEAAWDEGISFGGAGDMKWIFLYGLAGTPKEDWQCWAKNDLEDVPGFTRLRGPECVEALNPKGKNIIPEKFVPKFRVGNPCASWDNGVESGGDFQRDRTGVVETHEGGQPKVYWLRGLPFYKRRDTDQLVRLWSHHFQGASKLLQGVFSRRYTPDCIRRYPAYCECRTCRCEECQVEGCSLADGEVAASRKGGVARLLDWRGTQAVC